MIAIVVMSDGGDRKLLTVDEQTHNAFLVVRHFW